MNSPEKCVVCGAELMSFTYRNLVGIKFCRDCYDSPWGEHLLQEVKETINILVDQKKNEIQRNRDKDPHVHTERNR